MEKFTKQFILYFLLSLFITAIVPEVFIHAFAPHEDSIDFHSSTTSVSPRHIHCECLQDNLPSFTATQTVFLEAISFLINTKVIAPILFSEQLFQFQFSLRGPPAL